MRKRYGIVGMLLAGALALSLTPGHAGSHSLVFEKAQGIVVRGKLPAAGTFSLFLSRLDGARVDAVVRAVPPPGQPQTSTFVGTGPLSGTANGVVPNTPVYLGCISVWTRAGRDSGCELLTPTTLNVDPLMQGGSVIFSVVSQKDRNKQLVANLIVGGAASPTLQTDHVFTPSLAPAPPGATPTRFQVAAQAIVTRQVAVNGNVRSERIGGGAVGSVDRDSLMYSGFVGTYSADLNRFACAFSPQRCVP